MASIMSRNQLWQELLKIRTLRRGWHLARLDARSDFAQDMYVVESFAADLDGHLREIRNRLRTQTYQPRPLLAVEVPKGTLGIRPGKVIAIADRTVLQAVLLLIAPQIDKKLSKDVYSWRVKRPVPRRGAIFRESSIISLPFLKSKTIRKRVDPFDPWYAAWPEFDAKSKSLVSEQGYRFLATSDIAAYFENIQLPILRDQMLNHLPDEPKLVNLLFEFLDGWAQKTETGRAHLRGIPQGNSASSFLGNIFLMPLDEEITRLGRRHEIQYQRYMDDVRVFSKDLNGARRAIFAMDKALRSMHLNVQSAKTKIYDEKFGEVTELLIDSRIERLSKIIEKIGDKGPQLTPSERHTYLGRIDKIARESPAGKQPLLGRKRRPLRGLGLRAFQRWIHAHNLLDSHVYVSRLIREAELNPDQRLSQRIVRATKRFPRKHSIEGRLMSFIKSDRNIFPFQEAEFLRAIRYLGTVSETTIGHCLFRLYSKSNDAYLRVQSAYMLSRVSLDSVDLRRLSKLFVDEPDPYVQTAISLVLTQQVDQTGQLVERLLMHPSERIRDTGKLFHRLRTDPDFSQQSIDHITRTNWVICDRVPMLHVMASADDIKVCQALMEYAKANRKSLPIVGIRSILDDLYERMKSRLTA